MRSNKNQSSINYTDNSNIPEFEALCIRYSKRKSIAIYVKENLEVELRAPFKTPLSLLKTFYRTKRNWVSQKLQQQIGRQHRRIRWQQGAQISILGDVFTFNFIANRNANNRTKIVIQDEAPNRINIYSSDTSNPQKQIKEAFFDWLRFKSKEYCQHRVKYWRDKLYQNDHSDISIQIRLMKTRWGSCSLNHNMRLNILLMLVPTECLDYVIVHELCHWKFFDHSGDFYQLLETQLPQRKQLEQILKSYDYLLLEAKNHAF